MASSTAAHTDFEHGNFYLLSREVGERDRRHHFEEAGMPRQLSLLDQPLGDAIDLVMQIGELIIADFFAIHANAFVDAHQMGRSIEACFQAGGLKDRGKRRRRRAFAICSCDQHAAKRLLGMIHGIQEHAHVCQVEFIRRRMGQLVPKRVHARDCGLVGHGETAVSYQPSAVSLNPQIISLPNG